MQCDMAADCGAAYSLTPLPAHCCHCLLLLLQVARDIAKAFNLPEDKVVHVKVRQGPTAFGARVWCSFFLCNLPCKVPWVIV